MIWALVDSNDVVLNRIEYDGKAKVSYPDGIKVMEVNDWVAMGQNISVAKPAPKPERTAAELKTQRNEALSKDLSLKAAFLLERKANPDLTFSAYLDMLEAEVVV